MFKTEEKAVSFQMLEALFQQSFVGITVHRDFEILYTNAKVARILGYGDVSTLLARASLKPHVPARRQQEIADKWRAILEGTATPERNRVTNIKLDGSEIWLDITDERVLWEDGKPALMSTVFDVSHSVRTNESLLSSLRNLEASLDSVLETIPTGVAIFSSSGRPRTVNSTMRLMFQESPEKNDYVPSAMAELLQALKASDKEEITSKGVKTRMKKVVDLVARRMVDDAIMMCAADVSDWKDTQDKLKALAERDELTKLLNRRGFSDTVRPLLQISNEKQQQCALMAIDIDFFKDINDLYGHAVGDDVLKSFARRIQGTLRKMDIVGRIGGEEFAIFLPKCDVTTAKHVAERVRQKVGSRPIKLKNMKITVTISIGIKVWEGEAEQAHLFDLMQAADNALYRAKQAGRDRCALA